MWPYSNQIVLHIMKENSFSYSYWRNKRAQKSTLLYFVIFIIMNIVKNIINNPMVTHFSLTKSLHSIIYIVFECVRSSLNLDRNFFFCKFGWLSNLAILLRSCSAKPAQARYTLILYKRYFQNNMWVVKKRKQDLGIKCYACRRLVWSFFWTRIISLFFAKLSQVLAQLDWV